MTTRGAPDLLAQADLAERAGDRATAASKMRAHLALHGEDGLLRLRLGRLLLALAETASARGVVLSLEDSSNPEWASEANRLLASLEEAEGSLTSAQIRWERVLSYDVDDVEANRHLKELRPTDEHHQWPGSSSVGTLASPDGVRLSRYKLVRELGRGASAAVYLVRDERLNLPLALKVLHPQLAAASRAEAREKFFAEARLAARLRHPGVVAIYAVDEPARCLAMEYIAGGTVRDRLRAARAAGIAPDTGLEGAEVLGAARSLLTALAHVHRAGIVHGDLKPGNVLLRRPTQVVLADFGVAEFSGHAQELTAEQAAEQAAGTPLYLAPEQFRGARASIQTDLFATGAILWEMLRGRPARRQSDLLSGDYAAPSTPPYPEAAPTALSDLITALMATDPARRPPSAEAARALLG